MQKLPNYKSLISSTLIVGALFLATTVAAHASSGPVGLNQLRAEGGPGVGQVTLNWARYHPDVTDYNIMYGTKSGQYQYGVPSTGGAVSYTIGGLQPGVKYYFLISPFRNGQISTPASPEISEWAATRPMIVKGTSGPVGKRNLTATSGPGNGQVTLNWTQISALTDSFNIVYGVTPGKYMWGVNGLTAKGVNSSNSFTISSLNSGTRYYFAILPSSGGETTYLSAEVSQVTK